MTSQSCSQITAQIRRAWEDMQYDDAIDAALRTPTPHPEEREARKCFLSRPWQDIPDSVLFAGSPSPFLIGKKALLYYLPAFLIASITHSNGDTLRDYLVNGQLLPPKRPEKFAAFAALFDQLSCVQRQAVASYLRFLADRTESTRARKRIADSLERYWDKPVQ